MRRWKLKLIVGGILGLILIIFVFVPFNVKGYSNQGYQFIAYKRIITDSGGEEVNEINIIADLSSEEINFSNFRFSITTYLNKSWSASYGNEVDLDLMDINNYYLINRLLNYDDAAYFVTKLSEPFDSLESVFEYLGISYNEGYNTGYDTGYNTGYNQGLIVGGNAYENLIKIKTFTQETHETVIIKKLNNYSVILNGTSTGNAYFHFITSNTLKLKLNHQYLIYGGSIKCPIGIYASGGYDVRDSTGNGNLFTCTNDTINYSFQTFIRPNTTFNNFVVFPQLYDLTDAGITASTASEAVDKMKYLQGYNEGLEIGKTTGYDLGLNQGTRDSFTLINFLGNIISVFFSAAFTFLSFEVFGIKLWEIFSIAAAVGVIIIVYRLIKGGGD